MSKKAAAAAAADSVDDEAKLLEEAKKNCKIQAIHMTRCLDGGKLMDALKHASNMVCELRTSLLSPQSYYELYMATFDNLRQLESFLTEEKNRGKRVAELYELVQYAGNILPRLYLLITVGSVYIKTKEAPAKDVLRDLVEMCRGVQHPTRGLFLRNYLSEMTKDKLPDVGNEYEGKGGTTADSIDFVLQNFVEMNKLWVRMQHQGPQREKDKREKERDELRLLVGKNLSRLSQLDGVDLATYQELVLPSVLEQIINCKDRLAQQYLMECLIQVFPDEFHLNTLDDVLGTCTLLQPTVDVRTIVVSLIDRLANFSRNHREKIPDDLQMFDIFAKNIQQLVAERERVSLEDRLALQVALVNLSVKCYPERLAYVDRALQAAAAAVEGHPDARSPAVVKQILRLLQTPLQSYGDISTVLKLNAYPALIPHLTYPNRKKVAVDIVRNTIQNATVLSSADEVDRLLTWIQPLMRDEADQPEPDMDDFREEQGLVAALIHLWRSDNANTLFQIYLARKHFGVGGVKRQQHTLPALLFRALQLALRVHAVTANEADWAAAGKRLFKLAHELAMAVKQAEMPELAFRLFLQCAQAASKCNLESITYEFVTQAFVVYENEISDSASQMRAVRLLIGTVRTLRSLSAENYDTLATKIAQHSAKLLRKPDQCRCVSACAALFWVPGPDGHRDGKRLLECLQRALRIADQVVDRQNVMLFVEILNSYLYHFVHAEDSIPAKAIDTLVKLCNTHLTELEGGGSANAGGADGGEGGDAASARRYYQLTLEFIRRKKLEGVAKFAEIEV